MVKIGVDRRLSAGYDGGVREEHNPMTWHDTESMRQTLASYEGAFAQLLNIAPKLEPTGNGAYVNAFPVRFRSAYMPIKDWVIHITAAWYRTDELFDYGRPKWHGDCSHVWLNSYFEASFHANVSYEKACWEPGRTGHEAYVDDDGESHSAIEGYSERITIQGHSLRLDLTTRRYGLKNWWRQREEREALIVGATEDVQEAYQKALAQANERVTKWEKAMNEMGNVQLS